jgi:uncharacterized circularly permuted ATP-grasp superfamily protein/uncharacterized alpha-E superfamily protein
MLHLTDIGAAGATGADAFFAGYGEIAGHDEAFTPDGQPRPHWRGLLDWLGAVGREGYQAAALDLARLRTESGVAFASRPADAGVGDALPVVLSAADWAVLAAGIEQRARLAEAAIADVYTGGRAVGAGLLPPGLVYGGPAFAAHCAGWERPPRHWIHVYEADVARTADGGWVLLADRLDTPLGDGWLLANRIAVSQALAEPFVELGVRRLAGHYAAFQDHLDQMMGWDGRMALLTAGEADPRFFSHAYFARYMSAALIEPADLTVREGAAYVKTLDGLKRVDVLLRGVPYAGVDSLHRPGRAAFGAPALSLAARSGSLKIANAIGSAVFAHRALAPYAHRLAKYLLGEELGLADAPCLWLGTPRAREQVLAERERWRIQPLSSDDGGPPTLALDDDPDDPLPDRLARIGERLCAVQTPALARTPVWQGDGVRPAEWMMRVFACRTADGIRVVPGGVASVVEQGRPPPALGFGKDVWVLPDAARPVSADTGTPLSARLGATHLRRTGRDLLSRVADDIFWLGRNAERTEHVLRLLGVCLRRQLSGNRTDADPAALCTLIEILAEPDEALDGAERFLDAMGRLLGGPGIGDEDQDYALPAMLQDLRAGALRARFAISDESWRSIERLCADPRWPDAAGMRPGAPLARLIEDSVHALSAFAGTAQENLTRNWAWRFLEMGRRLERGIQISLVAQRLAGVQRPVEETYLRAWLTLSDSASAYRARYMMTAQPASVIDLLVLDETNPRSLAFQLMRLERVLAQLPSDIPYRRPEHRLALKLLTELRLSDAAALARADAEGRRDELVALVERCREGLEDTSDLIARAFFAHAEAPEALLSQARQSPRERGS